MFGEPTFADAIPDRLVHNAYRLELDGPSMRRSSDSTEEVDEGHRAWHQNHAYAATILSDRIPRNGSPDVVGTADRMRRNAQ